MAKQLLIKDGKLQTNASGELLIIPDGESASYCACCGGADPDPCVEGTNCTHCECITPSTYTVTFREVNLCWPYCDSTELYDWATGESDATLNTSHVLTQISSCLWFKSLTNTAAYITDSDQCGGSSSAESTEHINIYLTRSGSTWELSVEVIFFSAIAISLFYNVQNEDGVGVCSTVPTFTNDNASCSHFTFGTQGKHGTGGTATIETCDPGVCCACNPDALGSDPSAAAVTGLTGDCGDYANDTFPYNTFTNASADHCYWDWQLTGDTWIFVIRAKTAYTYDSGGSCEVVLAEGEWLIQLRVYDFRSGWKTDIWTEKTANIVCDPDTGKISGTHQFSGGSYCTQSADPCTGTPTVTIPV